MKNAYPDHCERRARWIRLNPLAVAYFEDRAMARGAVCYQMVVWRSEEQVGAGHAFESGYIDCEMDRFILEYG